MEAVCERIGRADRTAEMLDFVAGTLALHDWPGNVRELVNVVSVAASLPRDAASITALLPLEGSRGAVDTNSPFGDAKLAAVAAW